MTVIYRGENNLPGARLRFSHVITLILLLAFVAVFLIGAHGFYFGHWYTGYARIVAKNIPMPAASVNGDIIWYSQVSELANMYLQRDGTSEAGAFESALETSIKRKYLEHLALELGVQVSATEIEDYQIDQDILRNYVYKIGWGEPEYRRYVVQPLLLAQATEGAVLTSEEHQYAARVELEHVLSNLSIGIPFSDLVEQYSQDPSAVLGGDIGLFEQDELPEEIASVWYLEVDSVSEILDLNDAYALGYVNDEVVADEGRIAVGLQLISINKAPLSEVLEDYAKTQKVKVFLQ